MNKQLLSIMSLVALAVTQPSIRLVAAPPDGSTSESDRKFLSNLEKKEAAQQAPAGAAPQPQVLPTPVEPTAPSAPAPQSRHVSTQSDAVANPTSRTATSDDAPTAPVAADAPARRPANPRPAKSVARSVSPPARTDRTDRTDTTQTRTTAAAPIRREAVEEQSSSDDVQVNENQGVRAKIYRARPVDDGVAATSPRSVTRKTTRNIGAEEDGTHIVQPAEVAQYGVAPTVPTKQTRVTTTYVQQPPTVVRKEDRDDARDENHGNERGFFHRLFHGGLFNKHGED